MQEFNIQEFNHTIFTTSTSTAMKGNLDISSPVFSHNGNIPTAYTCEGVDKNPPLVIKGIPQEAKSLVLIMDDPDAPGKTFDHWVVWNIPPRETIEENSIPGELGKNSSGQNGYMGPCPPKGTHRYFFKVYALDGLMKIEQGADKRTVEKAIEHHIIAYGELVGNYHKQLQTT